MKKISNFLVSEIDKNKRIDIFLNEQNKELSRTKIKNLILEEKLKLNNEIINNPSKKISVGDKIVLQIPEQKEPSLKPYAFKLDIIYEDELALVFKDTQPQAPTHLLIIPKKAIPKLSDATPEDQALLGHLMLVAGEVSRMLELDDTFRLVTNNGANAGQSVFHLHLHLLSGRSLTWPPG